MSATINQIIAGTYPGGDTSRTLQLRSTSGTTVTLVDSVDTVLPLFTTVEAGSINFSASNTTDLLSINSGVITGTIDLNVHTTGSNVAFSLWLESSVNGGSTWAPVPNSLRQTTIITDATVVSASILVGNVVAGALTRFVVRRVGGTTCVIRSDVLATSTGNVTQQAMLIRLYGI